MLENKSATIITEPNSVRISFPIAGTSGKIIQDKPSNAPLMPNNPDSISAFIPANFANSVDATAPNKLQVAFAGERINNAMENIMPEVMLLARNICP